MTQAKPNDKTLEDYLNQDEQTEQDDRRYEWIDGALVEVPPESEPNNAIARYLFLLLVNSGIPFRLIVPHSCEVQVPVLQPGDAATRYPDLVILDEVHPDLMKTRLTIKREMPPPRLIAEVVSPGTQNRERDYERKRLQYAALRVPEYWLIDPEMTWIVVLILEGDQYCEIGQFRGDERIVSLMFPELHLTARQILSVGQ